MTMLNEARVKARQFSRPAPATVMGHLHPIITALVITIRTMGTGMGGVPPLASASGLARVTAMASTTEGRAPTGEEIDSDVD